jgi:hypothetical protein
VGLGQFREVFGQLGKRRDGVAGLSALGLDHALDETHLRVTGFAGQELIGLALCFSQLACAHQPVDLGVIVGLGQSQGSVQGGRHRNGQRHHPQRRGQATMAKTKGGCGQSGKRCLGVFHGTSEGKSGKPKAEKRACK